jgi:hypothetical protein
MQSATYEQHRPPTEKDRPMNVVRRLALIAVLVLPVSVSVASAGVAETVRLSPRAGSAVSGTATVSSPGDKAAAAVSVKLKGLKPSASVRVMLNVVVGGNTGASTTLILSARANGRGALSASGRVRYRGTPVTFSSIADGAHAISVVTGGKVVARGVIPGMS